MKIVFVSNYFNHHQQALAECLNSESGNNFRFIATSEMRLDRKRLGYGTEKTPYVILSYESAESEKEACKWIIEADVVIIGSAPEYFVKERLKQGKLTFRYSERPLKKGIEIHKYLYRLVKWHRTNPRNANLYLLCASAYAANDFSKFGLFKNRCFRWGYFPETKIYESIEDIISKKKKNTILWAGRFLDWKHPDIAIRIARRLKAEGFSFELNMIGIGEMEEDLKSLILEYRLEDCVHLLGSMKPKEVRAYMEISEIYLFTSDRNEGWGAVLNESMNSACAVVASHAIGSVPFMLNDEVNGLIYNDGDENDLYKKVKLLLENKELCNAYGKEAYMTMLNTWNADNAARRFIRLSEKLLNVDANKNMYESGPCSVAEIVRDDWYRR